jgi:hypothetical protein
MFQQEQNLFQEINNNSWMQSSSQWVSKNMEVRSLGSGFLPYLKGTSEKAITTSR